MSSKLLTISTKTLCNLFNMIFQLNFCFHFVICLTMIFQLNFCFRGFLFWLHKQSYFFIICVCLSQKLMALINYSHRNYFTSLTIVLKVFVSDCTNSLLAIPNLFNLILLSQKIMTSMKYSLIKWKTSQWNIYIYIKLQYSLSGHIYIQYIPVFYMRLIL